MKNWSAAEWLALAALVVAVVAIPLTLWATRQWGERRARLLFTYRSVPLLPRGDIQVLKVTYRDFEVPSPHLVTLRVRNVGPKDVASSHFDQSRPLRIDLKAKFYGLVDASPVNERGAIEMDAIGTDDGHVSFKPALLRRNQEWTAEVLVSGDSQPELTSSLIDTDVVVADADSPTAVEEFAQGFIAGVEGASVVARLISGLVGGVKLRR